MIEYNHYIYMAEGLRSCLYVCMADGTQAEVINRTMMRPFSPTICSSS